MSFIKCPDCGFSGHYRGLPGYEDAKICELLGIKLSATCTVDGPTLEEVAQRPTALDAAPRDEGKPESETVEPETAAQADGDQRRPWWQHLLFRVLLRSSAVH